MTEQPVVVHGAASPEELAVIVATLGSRRQSEIAESGYELWRQRRLRAVRETTTIA